MKFKDGYGSSCNCDAVEVSSELKNKADFMSDIATNLNTNASFNTILINKINNDQFLEKKLCFYSYPKRK